MRHCTHWCVQQGRSAVKLDADHAAKCTLADGLPIDGDYTGSEIVAALADLRFTRQNGFVATVYLDRHARDWLVAALRRP